MGRPKALAEGEGSKRGGSAAAAECELWNAPRKRGSAAGARGLTLIELLVVIVIIGILASITVTVASRVSQGGKVSVTQDALKIADQALNSYVQEVGAIPPPIFEDPRDKDRTRLIPVADARNMSTGVGAAKRTMINSCGLFIYQATKDAGLTGLFAGVDARLLSAYDPDGRDGAYGNESIDQMAMAPSVFTDQPRIPTLMDGFGRPIRYVHPAFGGHITGPTRLNSTYDGAQALDMDAPGMFPEWRVRDGRNYTFSYNRIRRNSNPTPTAPGNPNPEFQADSDGGRPVGNRPYFYSAGEDGDPSTIDDNVYAGGSKPEFNLKN